MFPVRLSTPSLISKRQDTLLYSATDSQRNYILKCPRNITEATREAYLDEYATMSQILHPSIPVYYGYEPDYRFDASDTEGFPCLCIEHCHGTPLSSRANLSARELKYILMSIGHVFISLLNNGILYLDLNPSNILIGSGDHPVITLLDYTFCYYFRRNPSPSYRLRFSYNLSASLPGQQLLIQEMSYFAHAMIDTFDIHDIPSSFYLLIESGLKPSEDMALSDYLSLLENSIS